MIEKLVFSSLLVQFIAMAFGANFCEDRDSLDRIFTMKNVTFVTIKGSDMVYRQLIGKPFKNSKDLYFENVFILSRERDEIKFSRIETGFMITKVPDCSSDEQNCRELNKLKGVGFAIGRASNFNNQVYRTYEFKDFSTEIKTLNRITDNNDLPYDTEVAGEIDGHFWPMKAEPTVVYMHSTYDERSFSIVHLIYDRKHRLFTYSLSGANSVPQFEEQEMSTKFESYFYSGFFYWTSTPDEDSSTRAEPNEIYAIGRSTQEEDHKVLQFRNGFSFDENSALNLDELYGCPKPTESSTQTTLTASPESEPEYIPTETPESEEYITTEPKPWTSSTRTTSRAKRTTSMASDLSKEPSSLWTIFWILLVLGLIGLIIIIGLIGVVCYVRQKSTVNTGDNPKAIESQSSSGLQESNSTGSLPTNKTISSSSNNQI